MYSGEIINEENSADSTDCRNAFLTHFQTLDVKLGELIEIRVVGAESEDRSLKRNLLNR